MVHYEMSRMIFIVTVQVKEKPAHEVHWVDEVQLPSPEQLAVVSCGSSSA